MALQASKIKALFLDLDGVVWHGASPIGDPAATFRKIHALNLLPLVGTNNATQTPEAYCEKFASFGVEMKPEYIFSPAIGSVERFREEFPSSVRIHVLGSDALRDYLRGAGFAVVDKNADVVLASLDQRFTYDKLAAAQREVLNGAKFYATNLDNVLLTEAGIRPGGGAVVAALASCTGVAPIVIGKPEPCMIQIAMRKFGLTPEEILVIGDRYDTDILGGLNAGCASVLVLSGVDNPQTIAKYDRAPDWICADLAAAIDRLEIEKEASA